MRITGGALRGRIVPGGVRRGTRPTASRVREALFSILGQDLGGLSVLDAFGGTGLLSFEALSRGALSAYVIERDGGALRQLRRSAEALGLGERLTAVRGVVPGALPARRFDLILLDPPYAVDAAPVLRAVLPLVGDRLVLEHAAARPPPELGGLLLHSTRRYGDTALSFFSVQPAGGEPRPRRPLE